MDTLLIFYRKYLFLDNGIIIFKKIERAKNWLSRSINFNRGFIKLNYSSVAYYQVSLK
jgi:hypothetical protein